MDSLITQVIAWPTLLVCLLVFGFAPGAVLRVIVLAFRRDDPRRRELLAELPNVPRVERPFWVCEQLEVALFEGLAGRLAALISRMRRGRRRRSSSGRPRGENAVSRYLGRRARARTQAAFALAGAGIVVGALRAGLAQTGGLSELGASGGLGAGYYSIRFAFLLAAIVLAGRPGPWCAAGTGIAAASAAFFLTDAVGGIHSGVSYWAWFEFLAVITFAVLLVIRLRPFSVKPPRLRSLSPAGRPLSFVPLAAAVAQFILLFVSFEDVSVFQQGVATPPTLYPSMIPEAATIASIGGMLAGLLAVVPIAGLCVIVALTDLADRSQRVFAAAAVSAYLGPELYFMLGSLISGAKFAYVGDDVWAAGQSVSWFVFLQAAVAGALAVSTLMLLLRSTEPARPVPDSLASVTRRSMHDTPTSRVVHPDKRYSDSSDI
jgi:hypothetical protein